MNVTTKAVQVKAIAAVSPVESGNPNGEFDVILSTPSKDLDGDEFRTDEWKLPLPEYITFDIDHGMTVPTTVGGGTPFINDDGNLQVRGMYSSLKNGQDTRTLVNEKIIRHVSVAAWETKDPETGVITRQLLNGTFTPVPANPEAVVLSSKAAVTKKDLTAISIGTKSITGSLEELTWRVDDAVCSLYGRGEYPWVRATFLDDDGQSGRVVYEIGDQTLSRGFRVADGAIELDADVQQVAVVTTVVGKSANRKPKAKDEDDDSATSTESVTKSDDEDDDGSETSTESITTKAPGVQLTNGNAPEDALPQKTSSSKSADIPAPPALKAADAAVSPDEAAEARRKAMQIAIMLRSAVGRY